MRARVRMGACAHVHVCDVFDTVDVGGVFGTCMYMCVWCVPGPSALLEP
jgi:hypothetical protein